LATKKSFGKVARPTNSDRQEITDIEINNLSQSLNISCDTDEEFFKQFTERVFQHFGWTYLPMKGMDINSQ